MGKRPLAARGNVVTPGARSLFPDMQTSTGPKTGFGISPGFVRIRTLSHGVHDMTATSVNGWLMSMMKIFIESLPVSGSRPDQGEQRIPVRFIGEKRKRNVRSSKRFQAKPWRHDITVGFVARTTWTSTTVAK